MTIRFIGAGFALVLALAACNQKQASTTPEAPAGPAASASATQPTTSEAAAPQIPHRFDSKTGRITFTMSGLQSGTETMSWDDWGARQATETRGSTSMGGTSVAHDRRVVFVMPDTVMMIDNSAKTVMKMEHLKEQIAAMTGSQDMREMSQEMMAKMGATKTGSDTVAGKACDVYSMTQMGMTVCTWKGVALKTEGSMMGIQMNKLATSVEENVTVDPALFEAPAGYTVQAAPSIPAMGQMPPGMPQGAPPTSSN